MCSSELLDIMSCLVSTSKDSFTSVTDGSFRLLTATSTGKDSGAVVRTVTGMCGEATGSVIGAGDEGVVAWGGGGGGGGDEGGESTVVDSAMTAGNCTVGGDGDAAAEVVASSGLDVT